MDKRWKTAALGLGWFSVGLGLAEVLAPRSVGRVSGLEEHSRLVRFYGLRELAAGLGILFGGRLGFWLWSRVIGDAIDLATLAPGLGRGRSFGAAAAVAGVTALDVAASRRFSNGHRLAGLTGLR
jgi:hypothetical protein